MSPIRPSYEFDNQLPVPRQSAEPVHVPVPLPDQPQVPQVVHIHQAPPDRTVQRIALGSGVGAGAVAAGVYFGPLLVGALTAIAANLVALAVMLAAGGWAVVQVVNAVSGARREKDARRARHARRRKRG